MFSVKGYLEVAYYLSGIVVSIVALCGLKQIRILKRDIAVRNERAAKEKAIEYSSRYLTTFVSQIDKFSIEAREAKLPLYDDDGGPIGDFTPGSVSKRRWATTLKLWKLETWHTPMNELEAISASFVTGVADETAGFDIIGGTFCGTVRIYYDILALAGSDAGVRRYYKSIVALYQLWAPRLSEAELRKMKEQIESELDNMPRPAPKKSIGVDEDYSSPKR